MGSSGSVPLIYASIMTPVPDLIDDRGGRIDRPFRRSGIPAELVSEPGSIVPLRDYFTLLEAAAQETGDEHFGLSLSERLKIEDLGPLGELLIRAPTVRRAIWMGTTLLENCMPAMRSWLEFAGENVRWHFDYTGIRDCREGRRLDCESSLLLYRTLIRLAAGPNWQPSLVLLEQATASQCRVMESRLGAPVRNSSSGYALVFPREVLDLPMIHAKPLREIERQALLSRMTLLRSSDSFVCSVKSMIRSKLYGGYPEVSAVARSTGLSLRTFQRRLAEAGIAYSDLVAEVRGDLAREMLADKSRSQLDVSLSLGYADAANFTRAFKHWTGVTPRQFRHSLAGLRAAI